MRRLAPSPVRAECRSNISNSADGGNFGAVPKPPLAWSNVRPAFSTAAARSSAVSVAGGPPAASAAAEIWRTMSAPDAVTSSRRVRQALATASSSWRNDPIPALGVGGK